MTQQKSENPIVPEGLRKLAPTRPRGKSLRGGGKGVPVDETTNQPDLPFTTAENPEMKMEGANARVDRDLSLSGLSEVPKVKVKGRKRTSATVERVTERLGKAWHRVASNRGAPGPDGITIERVRENLASELRSLRTSLLSGDYEPGEIRRVFIPKAGGKGERGLGIPNVRDRIVQEAVRQVL